LKVFVACSKGLQTKGLAYTMAMELNGTSVFFPLRDTKQIKTTANAVLHSNLKGIKDADEVHVIWDGSSYGTIFDIGMAYALGKTVKVVYVPNRTWYSHLRNNMGMELK